MSERLPSLDQLRQISQLVLTKGGGLAEPISIVQIAAKLIRNFPSIFQADKLLLLPTPCPTSTPESGSSTNAAKRNSRYWILPIYKSVSTTCLQGLLVCRRLQIMIDEYQDTNQLLLEMIKPLIDNFRSGNLFIVGDQKQNIYGFREADLRVFSRTTEELTNFQKRLDRLITW